jgi:hypothetical protein
LEPEKVASSPSRISLWPLALLGILVSYFSLFRRSQKPIKADRPSNTATNQPKGGQNVSEYPIRIAVESFPPPETPLEERASKKRKKIKREWYGLAIQLLTLVGVIAYACISHRQLGQMVESNKLTQQALKIGQQSYVTIGRPDGTVAEVVWPKDPKAKAGIIAYFRNSGHLPAKFNWGTWGPWWGLAFLPKEPTGSIEIKSERPFTPMWAGVTRKTGGVGGSGTITIAGDSLYSGTMFELPKEQMGRILSATSPPLQLTGLLDYCDNLGKYSCRQFSIAYLGPPYSRFVLWNEEECPAFMTKLRRPDPDIDYFPPCELADRERKMEEDARKPKH